MKALKLKVGKTYINGQGEHFMIIWEDKRKNMPERNRPFLGVYLKEESASCGWFAENGETGLKDIIPGMDLVDELLPAKKSAAKKARK